MTLSGDNHISGDPRVELEKYFGYVIHLANKYFRMMSEGMRSRLELADLVQDGYVGLLEAAQRFNPEAGTSFLTFAHYRISGEMLRGKEKAAKQPARLDDFAQSMDGQDDENRDPIANIADPRSLPSEEAAENQLLEDLSEAIEALDGDSRWLIHQRFLEGRILQDLADELGLSVGAIHARQTKALEELRDFLQAKGYSIADLPDENDDSWLLSPKPARERSTPDGEED